MSEIDHELKTVQPYFDAVVCGDKQFEIRLNDRKYQVGQTLLMHEYDAQNDTFSGRSLAVEVTYITDYAQQPGYIVMGIRPFAARQPVSDEELERIREDAARKHYYDSGTTLQEITSPNNDAQKAIALAGIRAVREALTPMPIVPEVPNRPKIVCLCGSGRFRDAFDQAEFDETLAGNIVLTIGCNTKDIARDVDWSHVKPTLDDLHMRKIDLADEVLILNVDGYIGESTARELAYAQRLGKTVRYWDQQEADDAD